MTNCNCKQPLKIYTERYDTYYCTNCDTWLEPDCGCTDEDCWFKGRPEKPSQMFEKNHETEDYKNGRF